MGHIANAYFSTEYNVYVGDVAVCKRHNIYRNVTVLQKHRNKLYEGRIN